MVQIHNYTKENRVNSITFVFELVFGVLNARVFGENVNKYEVFEKNAHEQNYYS